MTDIKLSLTDDTLKGAFAEAAMRALTQETRDKLVADALKHLITAGSAGYGRETPSPFAQAFYGEVQKVARDVIAKELSENEGIREKLRSLIERTMLAFFDENSAADLAGAIASAMREKISKANDGWR